MAVDGGSVSVGPSAALYLYGTLGPTSTAVPTVFSVSGTATVETPATVQYSSGTVNSGGYLDAHAGLGTGPLAVSGVLLDESGVLIAPAR